MKSCLASCAQVKSQISLCILAVWSGSSFFAADSLQILQSENVKAQSSNRLHRSTAESEAQLVTNTQRPSFLANGPTVNIKIRKKAHSCLTYFFLILV